jgi:murein DD-endopeptidase MepM/ murein hydrolase activator NlpD
MVKYFAPVKGAGAERRDEFGNMASYRKHPHRGGDWGFSNGSDGKDVYAMHDAVIAKNFWSDVLGWVVITKDSDGVHVLYAHLKTQSKLKKAQAVIGGETVLGQIGNTGSASVGAHLHVAASKNPQPHLAPYDELLDPFKLVDASKPKKPATDGTEPKKAPAKKKAAKNG